MLGGSAGQRFSRMSRSPPPPPPGLPGGFAGPGPGPVGWPTPGPGLFGPPFVAVVSAASVIICFVCLSSVGPCETFALTKPSFFTMNVRGALTKLARSMGMVSGVTPIVLSPSMTVAPGGFDSITKLNVASTAAGGAFVVGEVDVASDAVGVRDFFTA